MKGERWFLVWLFVALGLGAVGMESGPGGFWLALACCAGVIGAIIMAVRST